MSIDSGGFGFSFFFHTSCLVRIYRCYILLYGRNSLLCFPKSERFSQNQAPFIDQLLLQLKKLFVPAGAINIQGVSLVFFKTCPTPYRLIFVSFYLRTIFCFNWFVKGSHANFLVFFNLIGCFFLSRKSLLAIFKIHFYILMPENWFGH